MLVDRNIGTLNLEHPRNVGQIIFALRIVITYLRERLKQFYGLECVNTCIDLGDRLFLISGISLLHDLLEEPTLVADHPAISRRVAEFNRKKRTNGSLSAMSLVYLHEPCEGFRS